MLATLKSSIRQNILKKKQAANNLPPVLILFLLCCLIIIDYGNFLHQFFCGINYRFQMRCNFICINLFTTLFTFFARHIFNYNYAIFIIYNMCCRWLFYSIAFTKRTLSSLLSGFEILFKFLGVRKIGSYNIKINIICSSHNMQYLIIHSIAIYQATWIRIISRIIFYNLPTHYAVFYIISAYIRSCILSRQCTDHLIADCSQNSFNLMLSNP